MRSLLVVAMLLAACGKGDKPPAPSTGTPNSKPETGPGVEDNGDEVKKSPAQEAQVLFTSVCAACHGTDGSGNGPAAESLNPKPRNYTDAAWQAETKDEDIAKIIVAGGQAVGKSGMMPGQPQLADKPEVVAELVKIIRGFKK